MTRARTVIYTYAHVMMLAEWITNYLEVHSLILTDNSQVHIEQLS